MTAISEEASQKLQETWAANKRAPFTDSTVLKQLIDTCAKCPQSFSVPQSVEQKHLVTRCITAAEHEYYLLENADKNREPDYNIIYAHGGAFLFQMDDVHWDLLDKYLEDLSCVITILNYPLAPQNTCFDAFDYVIDVYQESLLTKRSSKIISMGDSSGGYLALALAQLALEHNLPQPNQIVLFSPWLDMALSQEEKMQKKEDDDALLGTLGLKQLGKIWSSDIENLDSWPPSPLFGPIQGLAPIHCICGSEEILLFDSLALKSRAEKDGVEVELCIEDGMWHDFILSQSVPEAQRAYVKSLHMISLC